MDNNTIDEQNAPRVSRISLDELKKARATEPNQQQPLQEDTMSENKSETVSRVESTEVVVDQMQKSEEKTDTDENHKSETDAGEQQAHEQENISTRHRGNLIFFVFLDDEEVDGTEQQENAELTESKPGDASESVGEAGDSEKENAKNNDAVAQTEQNEDDDTGARDEEENQAEADKPSEAEQQSIEADKTVEVEKLETEHHTVVSSDPVEYDDTNGSYTSNLDFTKNMSVKRYNLPKPKWPLFLGLGLVACVAVFVAVYYLVVLKPKPEVVVLSNVKFNVESIDSGYVGDDLDLRGVCFECTYSNGRVSRIYDIEGYITGLSDEFDSHHKVVSAGDNGYVDFVYQGNNLRLLTVTHDYVISGITVRIGPESSFQVGDTLSFENVLGFVSYEGRGQRLMSMDEILSLNAKLVFLSQEYEITKNTDGFVIPNVVGEGEAQIVFRYGEFAFAVSISIESTTP